MTANTVETVELGENEFVWVSMEDMTAYHTDRTASLMTDNSFQWNWIVTSRHNIII